MLTGPFDVETLKTDYPELNFATAVIPVLTEWEQQQRMVGV